MIPGVGGHWDSFRLEFDDDRHLCIRGHDGWIEPVCAVCDEPIAWVLDMMSFTTQKDGAYRLAHARCVWTPEAFEREGAKAPFDASDSTA